MIVRYTRRAQNDLANILNYLDKRSPRGALSVKLAISAQSAQSVGTPTSAIRSEERQSAACRFADIPMGFSGRLRRAKFGCCTFAMARGGSGAAEPVVMKTPRLCRGLNFRVQILAAPAQGHGRTDTTSFGKGWETP
jgi:plasmid stabilization system protein ParE